MSRAEHALVDFRLYLPRGWVEVGVSKDVRYRRGMATIRDKMGHRLHGFFDAGGRFAFSASATGDLP